MLLLPSLRPDCYKSEDNITDDFEENLDEAISIAHDASVEAASALDPHNR